MIKVDLLRCTPPILDEKNYFIKEISVQGLCDLIGNGRSYKLLDIRDNESYLSGHIKSAVHLNCSTNLMTKKSLLKLKSEIESNNKLPNVTIIYNQRNANLNTKLLTFLSGLNHTENVLTLQGGYEKFIKKASEKYIVKRNPDSMMMTMTTGCSPSNPFIISEDIMSATMSQITDFLYIGNEQDSSNLNLLKSKGITHILCVTSNTALHFKSQDAFVYRRIPASDSSKQDLMQFFDEASEFIDQVRLSNGRVLVHCLAGVSRSVTIVSAYLIKTWQLNVLDALDYIRERRSIAAPNFNFIGQLDRYSKAC